MRPMSIRRHPLHTFSMRSLSMIGALAMTTVVAARPPDGGAAMQAHEASDRITPEQDRAMVADVTENIAKLRAQGKHLPTAQLMVDGMIWPLGPYPGIGRDWHGISNFVDLEATYPRQVRDYTCGNRSYDNASGYNHGGTDFFIWPFPWHLMDAASIDVLAAAPGTLVAKRDGNDDRSCSFDAADSPNYVIVRHDDGTVARYLHLKRGSVTTLDIGSPISAGQVLGKVGSSGISTGPHLHLELRADNSANAAVIDPYHGECNAIPTAWADQRPYHEMRVNRLSTHSAPPVSPICPDTHDQPNFRDVFAAGDSIVFLAAYRDASRGVPTRFRVLRPDGSEFQNWSFDMTQDPAAPTFYSGAYWYWSTQLPANAPEGRWRFEATLESRTTTHEFRVGSESLAIADPRGLIGSWFDPATSGQGFEVQWINGNLLLVYFYGHRDDGSNIFLLGTREGPPTYGQPIDIPLYTTTGGSFTNFDPEQIQRADWGTLQLTFESCERATAELSGEDGEQSLTLERLGRTAGLECD